MSDSPVKIAFIGAGSMGQAHAKAFCDDKDVSCAGIFSRTHARAEDFARQFRAPLVARQIGELYEETRADLVVIAVPVACTAEIVLECMRYPWKMLIEKPAGVNYQQACQLFEESKALGKSEACFVALNRRFFSSVQRLRDLLKAEPVFSLRIEDTQSQAAALAYGHPPDVAKNFMFANSIHLIDLLRYLSAADIERPVQTSVWQKKDVLQVSASFSYADGNAGHYDGLWEMPRSWGLKACTPAAHYELRPMEILNVLKKGARESQSHDMHDWDQAFKPGLRLQAQHALQMLRGKAHELPGLEDSLKTMQLIEDIYRDCKR